MLRWLEEGVEDDTFNVSMNLARKSTRETKLLSNHFKNDTTNVARRSPLATMEINIYRDM